MRFTGRDAVHLHDPVTVATLLHPEFFELSRGRVEVVETPYDAAGRSERTTTPDGNIAVVSGLDPVGLAQAVTGRIAAALRAEPM